MPLRLVKSLVRVFLPFFDLSGFVLLVSNFNQARHSLRSTCVY
jgi:hypothetical protein